MGRQMRPRSRRLIAIVAVAWLAAVAVPPLALARWRATRLAELAVPAVQADWTTFRDAMREQSDRSGPVQRKVPKSVEPPELVWLRDYFWLAVAAWVILGGTLGGFFALIVLGVAAPEPAPPRPSRSNGPESAGR
jgi:hypothetical protein